MPLLFNRSFGQQVFDIGFYIEVALPGTFVSAGIAHNIAVESIKPIHFKLHLIAHAKFIYSKPLYKIPQLMNKVVLPYISKFAVRILRSSTSVIHILSD